MKNIDVKILTESRQVDHYVKSIQAIADSNKKALGFLTKSTFQAQADRGRLWVAINANSEKLIGYLLFGGRYPMLRIFHLYVGKGYLKAWYRHKATEVFRNFRRKK